MEDSEFQDLNERVEQLEKGSQSDPLAELRGRVDNLEAVSQSGPASGESERTQEMIEDLYRRAGDLEEEGERGAGGAGAGCAWGP